MCIRDRNDVWDKCHVIVENTYETPYQEHAFIEPECALAKPGDGGEVIVIGSMQCPFYARTAVARVLGLPMSKVRIIQAAVGGAFGGKEDVPSEVCARAALLSQKTGRPVLYARDRKESMVSHTKRHPFIIRSKLGADKEGRLLALDIEAISDQGAYASVGPFVLYRSTVHAHGSYDIPHARVDTKLVYTNNVLTGAFRGFGQPQVAFAMESQMEELAKRLDMDPLELRQKNLAGPGSVSPVGHVFVESDANALAQVVEVALNDSGWKKKKAEYAELNKKGGRYRYGIGAGVISYGVSLGREAPDTATSVVQITEDASVSIAHGGTEMGQGSYTTLAMIASQEMGVPLKHMHIIPTDTAFIQNSGPSVASRVTPVIGESVRLAAAEAQKALFKALAKELGCPETDFSMNTDEGEAWVVSKHEKMTFMEAVHLAYHQGACLQGVGHKKVFFDKDTQQQYFTFSSGAHVAEVKVDVETGQVEVLRITAVNDVGKAINPLGLEGQIEGGVTQGLGLAIMEEVICKEGRMLNPDFRDYIIPVSYTHLTLPTN